MENEKFECCCGKHFNSKQKLGHHKNYCKTYQRQRKQLEQEERDKLKLPNGKFKCKNPKCNNEHDGSFGSGLFCSNRCKNVYLSLKSKDSPKAKAHRKCLVEKGLFGHKRSPYGTWKCHTCDIIFNTKLDLRNHIKEKHLSDHDCTNSVIQKTENSYVNFAEKNLINRSPYLVIYHHVKIIQIKNIMTQHINNLVKHIRKGWQMAKLNMEDLQKEVIINQKQKKS